jgi:hypothetical protein
MTGNTFYLLLQEKLNKEYSDYLSPVKANRLIADGVIKVVQDTYDKMAGMKEYEILSPFIIKDKEISVPFDVAALDNGYTVLLHLTAQYTIPITGFTYSAGKFTMSCHGLRVGDTLKLVSGTITYPVVTEAKPNYFKISTTYTTGTLSLVSNAIAVNERANRKNVFSSPTKYSPKFAISFNPSTFERTITVDPVPDKATIDYLSQLPVVIDANDTITDLAQYYPDFFLNRLMDECVKQFAVRTKDAQLYQPAVQEIIDNP